MSKKAKNKPIKPIKPMETSFLMEGHKLNEETGEMETVKYWVKVR